MRNFVLFCLYTSLACLYSMVAGVAYISAVLSISFAHPLAFLTLLPTSISQFFSGEWALAGRLGPTQRPSTSTLHLPGLANNIQDDQLHCNLR